MRRLASPGAFSPNVQFFLFLPHHLRRVTNFRLGNMKQSQVKSRVGSQSRESLAKERMVEARRVYAALNAKTDNSKTEVQERSPLVERNVAVNAATEQRAFLAGQKVAAERLYKEIKDREDKIIESKKTVSRQAGHHKPAAVKASRCDEASDDEFSDEESSEDEPDAPELWLPKKHRSKLAERNVERMVAAERKLKEIKDREEEIKAVTRSKLAGGNVATKAERMVAGKRMLKAINSREEKIMESKKAVSRQAVHKMSAAVNEDYSDEESSEDEPDSPELWLPKKHRFKLAERNVERMVAAERKFKEIKDREEEIKAVKRSVADDALDGEFSYEESSEDESESPELWSPPKRLTSIGGRTASAKAERMVAAGRLPPLKGHHLENGYIPLGAVAVPLPPSAKQMLLLMLLSAPLAILVVMGLFCRGLTMESVWGTFKVVLAGMLVHTSIIMLFVRRRA
jgi:hypothetical protein